MMKLTLYIILGLIAILGGAIIFTVIMISMLNKDIQSIRQELLELKNNNDVPSGRFTYLDKVLTNLDNGFIEIKYKDDSEDDLKNGSKDNSEVDS